MVSKNLVYEGSLIGRGRWVIGLLLFFLALSVVSGPEEYFEERSQISCQKGNVMLHFKTKLRQGCLGAIVGH